MSPSDAEEKSNGDDNFLKTGFNNITECINLAGHVTNFVDNEGSLDFISNAVANPDTQYATNNENFSQLLIRDIESENIFPHL